MAQPSWMGPLFSEGGRQWFMRLHQFLNGKDRNAYIIYILFASRYPTSPSEGNLLYGCAHRGSRRCDGHWRRHCTGTDTGMGTDIGTGMERRLEWVNAGQGNPAPPRGGCVGG